MISLRVLFVSSGDFSRVDIDIEGDRRTVMCGTSLDEIADAAMDLRNDYESAWWAWHQARVIPRFAEREISSRFDALAA